MLTSVRRARKHEAGFTLIELMVVVAIIGILAAIAVPNFLTYRNKSRVSQVVGTAESVRGALAGYAADSVGNAYPLAASIADYGGLSTIVNKNGGSLPDAQASSGFVFDSYGVVDSDGDSLPDDYSMRLSVQGVNSSEYRGGVILISGEGVLRCTGAATTDCAP
jgi:prepilin-type N-terminal cleavage/methylation domain-containing protein